MKLKHLHIDNYKLLKNFSIDFNSNISILIGINGSGKSTLLEFISNTFYDLYNHFILTDKSKPTLFFKLRYEITYESKVYEIYITSRTTTKEYYETSIKQENGRSKKYSKAQIEKEFQNGYKDILPQNIVMYYSGISQILSTKFLEFQKDFIERSVKSAIKIDQPFFYFLPQNFAAILIALLSYQHGDVPIILENKFGIIGFKKITIKLKKPEWAKPGDFWDAKGDLRVFLEHLEEASYVNTHKTNKETDTYILINEGDLEKLWSPYGQEKNLFEYLATIQANDLIESIEIILTKNDNDISYNCLSEGEKQLLIIYGLKELLFTDNTLFLFDEPDTYLHPTWQVDFINGVCNNFEQNEIKNHFIITTHSPLLLANASNEITEVFLLKDTIPIKMSNYFGKEITSVLLELMGTKERNIDIAKDVSVLFNLIEEGKIKDSKDKLNSLRALLGDNEPVIIRAEIQIQFLEDELNEKNN